MFDRSRSASSASAAWVAATPRTWPFACPAPSSSPRAARSARSSSGHATRWASAGLYKDYAELLAHPGLDAVFLVTPVTLHPAQIIAGIARRQARVLRKAVVARPRRMPAGGGRSRKAPASQGDDRLRSPLRRELPGRAKDASPRARSAGRSWFARRRATRTIPRDSSCASRRRPAASSST